MSDKKSNFYRIISLVICVSFMFSSVGFSAAMTPAQRLEKGKQLYNQGKYDQAMDNFIDVFVGGNSEQIAEANEYVNMIHFNMGAVEAPKQVAYNPDLEKQRNEQGKELFGKKPQAMTEDEYAASKQTAVQQPAQADVVQAPSSTTSAAAAGTVASAEQKPVEQIIVEDADLEYNTAEQKRLRKELVDTDVATMTTNLLIKLKKTEGVNVYMRNDAIDAIDIDSDVIFNGDKNTFSIEGKKVLDDVYALMVLSGTPTFVLLPPGSYTDEVSIQGVRQTIALNSYLINMGISSGKINFNMGLTTEQPPAKFSNLEGVSIVFDYTAKPVLKQHVTDKNAAPRLSLAMYPFESITPADDQGMLVDFSVIQTANPVASWKLQIVQHAKDGKYYVVRQLSGEGPVYKQFFWNGRKQYFGQILPLGKYTMILTATDTAGKDKVVRRKVELIGKDAPKKAVAAKQPKAAGADAKLNYETPRLWAKPARHEKAGSAAVIGAEAALAQDEVLAGDEYTDDLDFPAEPAPAAAPAAAAPSAVYPTTVAPYDYNTVAPADELAPSAAAPDTSADPYPSQLPEDDALDY